LPLLRIVLEIASQMESVRVSTGDAAPQLSTDVSENQNANTFERDALDRVPVFDQDYITTVSRFLDDNAAGTNGVSLVVDGVEANGPGVSPSGVQEVKVNQNPYSARFARPGRARLEITTKSGTPQFHGTVNFLFRDSVFDAQNAFAATKPGERRQFYEGSLTGPLGNNKKNTFLGTLERDQNDRLNGGLAPRNSLHGPGYLGLDLNAERDFNFSKDKKAGPKLTVGLNAFNLLNHVNYITYIGVTGSTTGIINPQFDKPNSANSPRRLQLNLNFKF